jgi:hypothetical protein
MSSTIQFNDKALNEIAQSVAGKFKNFQANLDKTSADIRSLEKWLQDCGICFYIEVDIGDHGSIAWASEADTWRLMYLSWGSDENGIEYRDTRPLIEMPVNVRLRARPHLSRLLGEIASLVPIDEVEPENKKGGSILPKVRAAAKAVTPPDPEEDLDAIFSSEDKIPF